MEDKISEILLEISEFFKINNICDGLIHFGSSVNSKNFHDVDILCYKDNYEPIYYKKVLSVIYYFKNKYDNYVFTFAENEVLSGVKREDAAKKNIFAFLVFDSSIKEHTTFIYGLSKEYKLLFGEDPIVGAQSPSPKECIEYIIYINKIFFHKPYLRLKSFLRSALILREKYSSKDNLILEFEKEYNYKLSEGLVDLFVMQSEENSLDVEKELSNLYNFIIESNKFSNCNITNLTNVDLKSQFNTKVYLEIGNMLKEKKKKKQIFDYIDISQRKYERKFNS